MELHPRLSTTGLLLQEKKIILGSFPVWSLTISDNNCKTIELEKQAERVKRGDIEFFYGSSSNKFWEWYKLFLDEKVLINDVKSINTSLVSNQFGITDLIISCNRKGKSALDKHLYDRTYNYEFFRYPLENEIVKILCTSKGLMNDMLLKKSFFKIHTNLSFDLKSSHDFQSMFLSKIPSSNRSIKKPFFVRLMCSSGGHIECLAIPSPGSPFRRLVDFGLDNQKGEDFLHNFLDLAFQWFKN